MIEKKAHCFLSRMLPLYTLLFIYSFFFFLPSILRVVCLVLVSPSRRPFFSVWFACYGRCKRKQTSREGSGAAALEFRSFPAVELGFELPVFLGQGGVQ